MRDTTAPDDRPPIKNIGIASLAVVIVAIIIGSFFIDTVLSGVSSGPRTIALIDGKIQDIGSNRTRQITVGAGVSLIALSAVLFLIARRRDVHGASQGESVDSSA